MVEDHVGAGGPGGDGGGQHEHRRPVEMRVCHCVGQVRNARSQSPDQNARSPGELGHRVGHEAAGGLMLDEVKRDAGPVDCVYELQHFSPGIPNACRAPALQMEEAMRSATVSTVEASGWCCLPIIKVPSNQLGCAEARAEFISRSRNPGISVRFLAAVPQFI